MIWFYLDGEDSRDYGVYLQNKPSILNAEPDIEFVHIPGRDGSLTMDHGGYRDGELVLDCYIKDVSNLSAAYGFLNGYKKMILSTDLGHSYRVVFYGSAQADEVIGNMSAWTMSVPVRIKPFRYREPAAETITITSSGSKIENPGSAEAAPRITLEGNGDVYLMIGQHEMEFEGLTDGIVIDSETRKLLRLNGIANALQYEVDEFPMLSPGSNYIQWNGNVQSLKIEPRWRDR